MTCCSLLLFVSLLVSLLPGFVFVSADDDDYRVDTDEIMELSGSTDRNDALDKLHHLLSQQFSRSERHLGGSSSAAHLLTRRDEILCRGKNWTTEHKLQLDLEQAEYLAKHLSNATLAHYFATEVAPLYKNILKKNTPLPPDSVDEYGFYEFTEQEKEDMKYVYNKALYLTDFEELVDENGQPIKLLSENSVYNRRQDIEEEYQKKMVVVVDDLLTSRALQRIRQLLLESTVWYEAKSPVDTGSYVGAYINDGLHDRILLALALELQDALPNIMENNPLSFMWAYKYESSSAQQEANQGIKMHTDFATVNVNIWITPDDANLDKKSGGLIVYTTKPPSDVEFDTNSPKTQASAFVDFLEATNYANVTVPYRQNRAVIFDSALFHRTDKCNFKPGYENRRINLTILYGDPTSHDYDDDYDEEGGGDGDEEGNRNVDEL